MHDNEIEQLMDVGRAQRAWLMSRSEELGKVLDQCEFPTRYPFTVRSGDSWHLQDGSRIVFGSDWTFYSKELLRAHVVSLVNVKWEQKP